MYITPVRPQIDNDVILLRDWRPLLINVGYQFVMRYVNGHVRSRGDGGWLVIWWCPNCNATVVALHTIECL